MAQCIAGVGVLLCCSGVRYVFVINRSSNNNENTTPGSLATPGWRVRTLNESLDTWRYSADWAALDRRTIGKVVRQTNKRAKPGRTDRAPWLFAYWGERMPTSNND